VAKAWAPILRLSMGNEVDNSESEDDSGNPSSSAQTWDAKVTAAFSAFDHNSDGQLDKAELARGLKQLGVILFLPEVRKRLE
jgi:Ca2+-binding EF-hand superfamily protein